jgi:leucine dehydrogenase
MSDELQVPFDHELLLMRRGSRSGFPLAIAIHSTLGSEAPGLAGGGCRLARYEQPLDGLRDVLRLAQAMTRKTSIAGLRIGGGKCVIIAPGDTSPWPLAGSRREDVLRDLADLVTELEGRFIVGPDVGTTAADMQFVSTLTPHVGGNNEGEAGGTAFGTALGLHACMRAAAEVVFGTPDLSERRVTVIGLGGVGELLARRLAADGATLVVTDIDEGRASVAKELGAQWISPEGAQRARTDILAPCALGGTLTVKEAGLISCPLIVGAANNQLASDSVAAELLAQGITWVPDFLANAGGILYAVATGRSALTTHAAGELVLGLGQTTTEVLRRASERDITTLQAALDIADEHRRARAAVD